MRTDDMNRFRLNNHGCESFLIMAGSAKDYPTDLGFPVRMRKVLGILTQDFRLYHDLVAALKARD